jgi:adenylate cyclase
VTGPVPEWRLAGLTGQADFLVRPGRPLLVGRGTAADLVLNDSAVSRLHAELEATRDGVRVRDLASANGVLQNGASVTEVVAVPGDVLTFGRPAFRVETPGADLAVEESPGRLAKTGAHPGDDAASRRLLEVAGALASEADPANLAALVAELAFQVVPADRVAVLVAHGDSGPLVPVCSRSRVGPAGAVRPPRAIVERAARERRPVLTDDALADAQLQSGSVVASRVRSAIAAPMLSAAAECVGVLYADRIMSAVPFTDEEAGSVLAFAALAGASVAREQLRERVRVQEIHRHNLERFLAPEVAAVVAAAGGALGAGGERCTVTVLFSDIRGFTALSERLPPKELAQLLTEYLAEMTEAIFAFGGTLDKFLGDGILAVWGAPVAVPDDARRALDAARAMRAALGRLNRAWRSAQRPTLAVGIGLARGEVFAGRIGGDRRLDHTVIGDAVNIAARLSKEAGDGTILLSGDVCRALETPEGLRRRSGVAVRGREGAVEVWEAGDAE